MRRQPLRLLADDLTGALDSAAAFASSAEPVAVGWRGQVPETGAVALDSRTREASADEAKTAVAAVARQLWAPGSGLAFKKIDSLLRGQEAAEIAAILAFVPARHCIIAPAFPAQRRITRDGRQHVQEAGGDRPVPVDLAADLERAGLRVAKCRSVEQVPDGVSLWDAESDAELDAIVAAAAPLGDVLWVGSAGLAAALARAAEVEGAADAEVLPRPILGLIGSEHNVIRTQLARLGPLHLLLDASGFGADLGRRLAADGAVFVSVDLPAGTSRRAAAAMIESRFADLLATLGRPGTLVAAGGETLRGLCEALGADRLDVVGDIMPGVPRSILRGGRWDGVTIVSKSGAFGGPDLLKQLVADTSAALAGAAA
ncbi:four-carbon acid sugar kinase family protein [Bosea sp. (in: a-proteobacteria)]|uniref:four-carbon acid sugar kinase family protein n=1 Tax=Bosea sp. (in: a-proteobacteria) TaxID=1871050 RepID=UPI003B3BD4CA